MSGGDHMCSVAERGATQTPIHSMRKYQCLGSVPVGFVPSRRETLGIVERYRNKPRRSQRTFV